MGETDYILKAHRLGVKVDFSRGYGKDGKIYVYLRPVKECFNRSRRVGAYEMADLGAEINKCIDKWFTPVNYYKIKNSIHPDGTIIGSSTEENALKEFWRVCEIEDKGKILPIRLCDTEKIN